MSHREVMQQALEAIRIFREWETGQDYESCRATVLARALAAEESLGAALAEPQRQPLTDEEIDRITDAQWAANNHKPIYAAHRAYARAIEAAHGIGGDE